MGMALIFLAIWIIIIICEKINQNLPYTPPQPTIAPKPKKELCDTTPQPKITISGDSKECPECKTKVSLDAEICNNCGYPFDYQPFATGFQNNLKLNMRTKEQIAEDTRLEKEKEIKQNVEIEADKIRKQLTDLAKTGEYKINQHGQKVVTTVSSSLLSDATSQTLQEPWYKNRSVHTLSQNGSIIVSVKEEYKEELNTYIKLLSEKLSPDGIFVEPAVWHSQNKCTYDIPATFMSDYWHFLDEASHVWVVLQYSCIIPEPKTAEQKDYSHLIDTDHKIADVEQDLEEEISSLKDFDALEGHDFEYFCAELLKKNGYTNVSITSGSGDQGIDVLATKDGIKFGFQCKRYDSSVGNYAVQEAYSGINYYNCHIGIVLTNNYFTQSAIELSNKLNIVLWNRDKLLELIKNSQVIST